MFSQTEDLIKVTIPPTGNTSGWPGQPGRTRVALTADSTVIYDTPSLLGPVTGIVRSGDEVDLGKTQTVNGVKWCGVTLREGRTGYIPAETTVRALKFVKLQDRDAEMRTAANAQAPVTRKLARGDGFLLLYTVEGGGWVRIRDAGGQEGFIGGKVKIASQDVGAGNAVVSDPGRDMMVGGLWCVGGILVTALTYSAASGGGHYVVAWGAIIFGGIQFLRGLFRSMF